MAEQQQRELVLAPNEVMYVLDRTSGKVLVYRGPYKEALAEASKPVTWDGARFVEAQEIMAAIQPFVTATEGQYVVLRNPAKDTARPMSHGKNDATDLLVGKTIVLQGPTEFPLWPGQTAEVINGHQLDEDQYLEIRVIGPVAVEDAERLWPIVREDWWEPETPAAAAPATPASGATTEGAGTDPAKTEPPKAPPAKVEKAAKDCFPLGAEFIVRGSETSFFIPPTGIIVLPVKDASKPTARLANVPGAVSDSARVAAACDVLGQELSSGGFRDAYVEELRANGTTDERFRPRMAAAVLERWLGRKSLSGNERVRREINAELEGTARVMDIETFTREALRKLATIAGALRAEASQQTTLSASGTKPSAKYMRHGVQIAADEFVVLVNRIGRRSYVRGPTTAIPCIDQEFVLTEEGTAVFQAVPIDENSGVLLRTLAEMTVAEARKRVPGVQMLGTPNDTTMLPPGTKLVVWKRQELVFPADGIEILRRFEASHILAGTARYVKDLTTGKTRVVRGERLYLPDPRVEEFIERVLSAHEVQLWFPNGGHDPKLVPCITVQQGTAAMVLGADQNGVVTRKVLVGHTVHFLEWDELLAVVAVSGSDPGQAKTYKKGKHICFLWTTGNRINDVGDNLRSKDDCAFVIEYTLTVDFDPAQQDSWFAVDDYVLLVCDEVRSRLLGTMLQHPIHDVATDYIEIVRNAILGKKEGNQPRPGLPLPRCGARLVDINVRSFRLSDATLQGQIQQLQRASVDESIKTRRSRLELEAQKERADIEADKAEATETLAQAKKDAALAEKRAAEEQAQETATLERATAEARIVGDQALDQKRAEADKEKAAATHASAKLAEEQQREIAELAAETRRLVAEVDAKVAEFKAKGALKALEPAIEEAKQRTMRLIEQLEGQAGAQATVLNAVLPQVAADIRLLASVEAAKPAIEALGQAASFKGMDVTELLGQLAGGTPVIAQFLASLKEAASKLGGGGPNGNGAAGHAAPATSPPAAPPAA
ncbi:MAG: hypothetical protein Q7R80_02105 [bacterium]|nr:hypothetical protein [bacterium]